MQKVLILFLFSCTLATQLFGQKPKDAITVAFYNIENLFDTLDDPKIDDAEFLPSGKNEWNAHRYNIKLDNMAKAIAQIGDADGPEILGLAEVENLRVLQDLAKHPKIKNYKYEIVHYDSPDERGIDVAMFYKPSAFKPLFSRPVTVNLKSEKDKTRDILYVVGKSGKKDSLHIFVNHWPSRRGGEEKSEPFREQAARVARTMIDSILRVNGNAKIILMGDLNDDPNNNSVKKVLGAKEGNAKYPPELFNALASLHKKESNGTLNYKGQWNLFDQIIISKGLRNVSGLNYTENSASIYKPDFLILQEGTSKGSLKRTFAGPKWFADGFSDHLPVYIQLTKK